MRVTFHIRWLVSGLMMVFGLAPAVSGADITIPAGTDLLYTLPGTFYNFPAPIGTQPLVGNPIFARGADTLVQRLADADATTGVAIDTLLTGLSLHGTGAFSNLFVTLDPAHFHDNVNDNTGTMSFLVTSPVTPGTVVSGTISDTLNVYFQAAIPGDGTVFGHELFTSSGTWRAFLPANSNEVDITTFQIIIDIHIDPNSVHVVTSLPEPSTWIMLAAAGLIVPAYAVRRGRRRP